MTRLLPFIFGWCILAVFLGARDAYRIVRDTYEEQGQ